MCWTTNYSTELKKTIKTIGKKTHEKPTTKKDEKYRNDTEGFGSTT